MLFKPVIINALEITLNQYINLDQNLPLNLAELAGKVIAITVTPFNETFYLCPNADSIQCLENFVGAIDVNLTGSVFALGFMGISTTSNAGIQMGQVTITGDVNLGQHLQQFFQHIEIDISTKLSPYIGSSFAQQLNNFFQAGIQWQHESIHSLQLNLNEFLQEETQTLPTIPEVELFYTEIKQLNLHYERLDTRLHAILRQLQHKEL